MKVYFIFKLNIMARRGKTSRSRTTKRTKAGYRCKGKSCRRTRRTKAAYPIPAQFACDGMRGPATSVITTNSMYNNMVGMNGAGTRHMVGMNGAGIRHMPVTNANYGWGTQTVDDNKSSGLSMGPQPFKTTNQVYTPRFSGVY